MQSLEETIEGARARLVDVGRKKHPYIAASLSTLEIQAALIDEIIEKGRGHVYLPSHHASAYYCVLAEKGQPLDLKKLGTEELPYLFHTKQPSVEYNSGPMGASMPIAVSEAIISPTEKSFVVIGNAEMREGRTFEALACAASENINNLVVMVNDNGKGLDGETSLNYTGILRGFGFEVRDIDGHDVKAIQNAIREVLTNEKRYGIVCRTQRGYKTEFVDVPHCGISVTKSSNSKIVGKVISRVAKDRDFTVLAADTAKSTGLEDIERIDPSRLMNVGCSEQLLVGGLEAYLLQGKPVVAGTFAKFLLETAREQLEHVIADYREGHAKAPTVLIGTHNGLSPGINGRSHHALTSYEFLGRKDINVYHANGETQLEAMIREALGKNEVTIILTERESDSFIFKNGKRVSRYEDLYNASYQFKPGRPEEMTGFTSNNYTLIITNGLRIYDALEAAKREEGAEVLSLPSWPLVEAELIPYVAKARKVVIVEESIKPYLGEKVELIGLKNGIQIPYAYMYVTNPIFGGYENLIRRNNLNARAIQEKIK